jgi:hypothetical protein
MITSYEVLDIVMSIFSVFESPIFLAMTLMIAISVAFGIKKLFVE